jgi:hypothetical protein
LHHWFFGTKTFRAMHGEGGGLEGVDEAFARRSMEEFGAFILGRNMFGPVPTAAAIDPAVEFVELFRLRVDLHASALQGCQFAPNNARSSSYPGKPISSKKEARIPTRQFPFQLRFAQENLEYAAEWRKSGRSNLR